MFIVAYEYTMFRKGNFCGLRVAGNNRQHELPVNKTRVLNQVFPLRRL